MPKLIPIDPKKLMKILLSLGFILLRIKGSHHTFSHKEKKLTVTIPLQNKEEVSQGILKVILKQSEISMEQYENLRKKK